MQTPAHSHSHAHDDAAHAHGHHHSKHLTAGEWVHAHPLPKLPEIGRHAAYYAEMLRRADCAGDKIAHESWKVGQYVSCALDPNLDWERKVRYFDHALRKHCTAPLHADEKVQAYFRSLAALVRKHAGTEVLKVASRQDDAYAQRLTAGEKRAMIVRDAQVFFAPIFTTEDGPEWLDEEDAAQLKLIQMQWV
jgi:hypothetical protein